jgi:hypothetical protein
MRKKPVDKLKISALLIVLTSVLSTNSSIDLVLAHFSLNGTITGYHKHFVVDLKGAN